MAECNVISHRGANQIAPQNTLEAFKRSILFHVDGFETDVHLTKDEIPVICHNYTVDKTSNGKGEISSHTLDELRDMDFGSYFHHSYKGTKMPTLDEFLSLLEKATFKILNIEIKSPKDKNYRIVGKVLESVKEHGLYDKLLVSSFDPEVLVDVKEEDESCKTGFLYSPDKLLALKMWNKAVDFAKSIGADALHPHQVYVSKEYVEEAHENNIMVNPWTVNKQKDIIKMVEYGVDGIITDVPNIAKKVISEI
jgi:glycerophosphoryl diester phosphodiesterase